MWYLSWWLEWLGTALLASLDTISSPVVTILTFLLVIVSGSVCIVISKLHGTIRFRAFAKCPETKMPTACDYAAILFLTVQIFSIWFGLYRSNSVQYGLRVATAVNLYTLTRLMCNDVKSSIVRLTSIGACVVAFYFSIVNIPALA